MEKQELLKLLEEKISSFITYPTEDSCLELMKEFENISPLFSYSNLLFSEKVISLWRDNFRKFMLYSTDHDFAFYTTRIEKNIDIFESIG